MALPRRGTGEHRTAMGSCATVDEDKELAAGVSRVSVSGGDQEAPAGFGTGRMPEPPSRPRRGLQRYLSQEQSEGAGARVRRSIGRRELQNVDPFLMLDEFKVPLPAGFPDHPHRGFETVTYMLPSSPGAMTHEDSAGNAGTLRAGDLQWMTAARGILHSEVPESRQPAHGIQMWINLAAKDKMSPPSYQEISRDNLTRVEADGVRAIVVAGEALGAASQVVTRTPCYFIHFFMEPGALLHQPIPPDFTAFVYTLQGDANYGGIDAGPHYTITLSQGGGEDGLVVRAGGGGASFVVVGARPIGEPIVQHGPFVMCTAQEIRQAIQDFQSGRNGFEGADRWSSKNQRRMVR